MDLNQYLKIFPTTKYDCLKGFMPFEAIDILLTKVISKTTQAVTTRTPTTLLTHYESHIIVIHITDKIAD